MRELEGWTASALTAKCMEIPGCPPTVGCGDRHTWVPDPRHAGEGYRCADCHRTETEVDGELHVEPAGS